MAIIGPSGKCVGQLMAVIWPGCKWGQCLLCDGCCGA